MVRKLAQSAEFRLAVACCKYSFGDGGRKAASALRGDWSAFLRLVRFHRIEGLAWNALSSNEFEIPEAIRTALSEAASAIAARNLHAAAECRALLDQFNEAGIALLFLKGLTLGALAYGNPALKAAIDIDALVDPADLRQAANLLHDCGYGLMAPRESANDQVLYTWHRSWKESVWAKDEPPVQIDLHTRTADNRRLIPEIDVHAPWEWVEIGSGIRLPTLAKDELFSYLAVHGASSAWFRLKWISDFAALLQGETVSEIERRYRRSQELGAGRAAGQALLLADELFETLQDNAALREELERDRPTERLFRTALRLVTGEPVEPTDFRWGTLPIHRTQFLLLPGLQYKASELTRQAGRILSRTAI
jgi:hypothetical protein